MSQERSRTASKRRRNNDSGMDNHYEEDQPIGRQRDAKTELLDIETVDTHDDQIDQDELSETTEDQQLSEALGFAVNKKVARGRKRQPLPDNPDGSRQRYYDRYKNMDYVKRNDVYKYCQACKKKVFGRLRSLPSEHRLRRCWILRLNLDVERSAELWSREAFSDATHCGEICQIHFPIGSENAKNRELLPTDMRMGGEADVDDVADANYDFDALELTCIFCSQKNPLRCMVPFVRTRSRRYKWISALSEANNAIKNHLQDELKNGASKFLCDWHFNDHDFDINQYGEWRLRKDALPSPMLTEADKKTQRVYMINHGDTILGRTMIPLPSQESYYQKKDYRLLAQKARRTTYSTFYGDFGQYQYDPAEVDPEQEEVEMTDELAVQHYIDEPPLVERDMAGPSTRIPIMDASIEYSDDSDEENAVLEKISPDGKLQETRFCVQCNRFVSSAKSMKEYRPRTWPYDESKHQKWLEFMNYPRNLEDSVKDLWRKRRHAMLNQDYHYTPLSICQAHLNYKQLYERYDDWLQTYCVLCDVDHGDPNLLLPFPRDRADRVQWLNMLTSIPTVNQAAEQRWNWLKERLTRPKPTRYRLCVFHFQSTSFVEKDDCVEFNDASLPLPLGLPEYNLTPRGIWAYIKCPLCDEWAEPNDLVDIRSPSTQAERVILVEMLNGDKTLMKKGIEQLCVHPCKICRVHLPTEVSDPYSVVAERKLVHDIEIQCVQCNHRDIGRRMVPFPFENEQRRHWVEALSRDHATRQRLIERLSLEGRHYICTAHFHKSALRYIPNLGVWKRFTYLPLAVTVHERGKYLNQEDDTYHALMIAGIDTRGEGVVQELNYDEVMNLFMDPNTTFDQVINRSADEVQYNPSGERVEEEDLGEEPPVLQPEGSHHPDKQIKYETEDLSDEISGEIIEETIEEHIVVDEHAEESEVEHGNYVEEVVEDGDFYE